MRSSVVLLVLVVCLATSLVMIECRRRRRQCHDDTLESRGRAVPVIFTGTVQKVYRRRRSLVYRGTVRVRRVIKGTPTVLNNQSVIVNGFGNPHICKSDVRPRDTRIFLLATTEMGRLELNSSLARVTLRNLRRTGLSQDGKSKEKSYLYRYSLLSNMTSSSASSTPLTSQTGRPDVPVKKRPLVDEAPCEKKMCAYGSICVVDKSSRAASCRCDITCNNVFAPVCGSDDVTYTNECHLNHASCTRQKHIQVKTSGSCDAADPCASKKCSFHSTCVVQMDGVTPECLCPEKCARYGDNRGSQSVCGTDGVDYPLVCELKRAACTHMKDIQIKYRGLCDPCEGVDCPANQVCQLEKNRKHVCRCNGMCSKDHDPVCGSDGKTYTNECVMRVEACRTRKTLRAIYKGECSSRVNPCNSVQCHPGEHCHIDRLGIAHCHCPEMCEAVMKPVCGTDLNTYDNECELKRKACIRRLTIQIKYRGICSDSGPCSTYLCGYGATCVAFKGQPRCECPTCSAEFKPVCGSNGITYNNECKLKRENCEKKKEVQLAYPGLCNGCEKKKCDFYSLCESDGNGNAVCICPEQCVNVNSTVCGSDGVTYVNECELKVDACKKKRNIKVESRGACDLCKDVHCKFGAKCENGNCVCPMDCPNNYNPLCGSNGVTYINECHLKRTECQMGTELIIASYGECEEVVNSGNGSSQREPCGGLPPLVDETSGKQLYCGEGVGGISCPHNSYCHKSPYGLFAKCCKQVMTIRSCSDSQYGCCPDRKTAALGTNNAGCPSVCMCNKLGSEDETCDPITRQCPCRPGVGGLRCDRCEPGYWGLPMIAKGNSGCVPCGCSLFGSVRDDCEQMTGRCVCKSGISGMKCKQCPTGQILGPKGCQAGDLSVPAAKDCSELTCFFGARCIHNDYDDKPGCVCDVECSLDKSQQRPVCGSDGQTYGSECQLKQFSCRYQKDIVVSGLGPCRGRLNPTRRPKNRRRGSRRKQGGSRYRSNSNKATRHIQLDEKLSNSLNISKTRSGARYLDSPHNYNNATTSSLTKGVIGSRCTRDVDCIIRHTECLRRRCRCQRPRRPSDNSLVCYSPTMQEQCSNTLCNNKGSCFNYANGSFYCSCSRGWTGRTCDKTVAQVDVPAFMGDSHMKTRKIRGYKQLIINLSFRTFAMNGVILYNGQNINGNGDFLSLAIKEGYIEFRYDLGNGPVVIRSFQKIELNKVHKILAKRYLQDGVLELDGISSTGRSQGTLKGLNLRTDLFIGNTPSSNKKIQENVGVNIGLVGCIQKLKIGRREVNLQYPSSRDIKSASNIGECKDNPCSSMSCKNGATCIGSNEESYKCMCRPGYTGRRCESTIDSCSSSPCSPGAACTPVPNKDGYMCTCPVGRTGKDCNNLIQEMHEVYISDFKNNSYLQLPRLRKVGRAFKIEVWAYVRSPNGIILYNGQHANGQGDFISLNVVQGHLQFKFNLGSGSCNITSPNKVSLRKWHIIRIQRKHRKGMLQVDDGPITHGQSAGSLTQLNVRQPFFLGGYRGKIHPESMMSHGLDGAIQRIIVNGDVYEDLVMRAHRTHKVSRYVGSPCYSKNKNPCLNGGVCIPRLGDFTCKCPLKHMGKLCERMMSDEEAQRPIHLDGKAYLKFPTDLITMQGFELSESIRTYKGQKTNRFEISLKTKQPNGLIIWMNKGATIRGDYLSVALRRGHVELSYNLGKQLQFFVIRSKVRVDDGLWHTIYINRRKRAGTLQVDDNHPVKDSSRVGATQLNTHGYLWLGGSPSLPSGLPEEYSKGFVGCIRQIKVDDKELDPSSASTDSTIRFCSSTTIL